MHMGHSKETNKSFGKQQVLAVLVTLLVSGGLVTFSWFCSDLLDKEIEKVQYQLKAFNVSLSRWQQRPLSKQSEEVILKTLDHELNKCDSKRSPFENLDLVHHLIKGSHDDHTKDLYLKMRRPSGHLISTQSRKKRFPRRETALNIWTHNTAGNSRLCNGIRLDKHRLKIEEDGFYYLYSQLKFDYQGSEVPALHRHLTYRIIENENQNPHQVSLFENSYHLGKSLSRTNHLRQQTSHQSGLVRLYKGNSVEVRIQGPSTSHLRSNDADTFFGLFLVAGCDE